MHNYTICSQYLHKTFITNSNNITKHFVRPGWATVQLCLYIWTIIFEQNDLWTISDMHKAFQFPSQDQDQGSSNPRERGHYVLQADSDKSLYVFDD